MLKRLFLLMLLASLSTYTLGCSSSESENEGAEATADADLEATTDEDLDGETATEGEPEGDVLADLGGEEGTDMAEGDVKPDEAISEDSAPSESSEPSDQAAAPIEESTTPPEEPAPSSGGNDLFGGTSTESSDGSYAEPKPMASLKKMQTTPYKQSGVLVNTVYLARQDDNLESVSQKTGASSKDLKKVNGFLSRGVKVGDKIYYNSKNRPTDSERVLTYYEDNNMPPEIYTAKAGDNIRTVSTSLLGHKDSWKEVWATNLDVESKQEVPEGTQLRYWSAGGAAIPVAANEPPPIQEAPSDLPPPTDPGAPSADPLAAGSLEPPPPPPSEPPPPPVEPPPSAKPPKVAKANDGFLIPGLGQDETFAVGAAALFLALGGFVIILKRNRARKLSSQTQTQI